MQILSNDDTKSVLKYREYKMSPCLSMGGGIGIKRSAFLTIPFPKLTCPKSKSWGWGDDEFGLYYKYHPIDTEWTR